MELFHLLSLSLSRYLCRKDNFDPMFKFAYRGPVAMKGKKVPMAVFIVTRDPLKKQTFADYPKVEGRDDLGPLPEEEKQEEEK